MLYSIYDIILYIEKNQHFFQHFYIELFEYIGLYYLIDYKYINKQKNFINNKLNELVIDILKNGTLNTLLIINKKYFNNKIFLNDCYKIEQNCIICHYNLLNFYKQELFEYIINNNNIILQNWIINRFGNLKYYKKFFIEIKYKKISNNITYKKIYKDI